MKVLIQGLGEVPATVEYAIEKEKADVSYILCSKYQMNNIASSAGYKQPSQVVIESVAKKVGTKIVWKICDIFDVKSIENAIAEIFKKVKPKDEVVVNYTGGAASVKLLMGLGAMLVQTKSQVRLVYALRYKAGTEVYLDQTEDLKDIFKRLRKIK